MHGRLRALSFLGPFASFRRALQGLQPRQRSLKELVDAVDQKRIQVDVTICAHLLQACGDEGALLEGKRVHAHVVSNDLERDVFLGKHLVHMYLKCGSLVDARHMFEKMEIRNVILWSGMIAAYAQNGHHEEAMLLFKRMHLDGIMPNEVTFLTVLSACAAPPELADGRMLHVLAVESGFQSNVAVGTALVSMYSKCGSLEAAHGVFDQMPQRNVVSWSTMIAAHSQYGQPNEALKLFQQMQLEGVQPDKITFVTLLDVCSSSEALPQQMLDHFDHEVESNVIVGTALLGMYSKRGMLHEACSTLSRMRHKNVVSWTAMIAAYCEHECWKEAFQTFQEMQLEGVLPNAVVLVNVLNACTTPESLSAAKRVHALAVECGVETDVVLRNALVNMYGKCGMLKEARVHLNRIHTRDLVSWNGMLAAYAQHGHFKEALQLFSEMQLEGVKPNKATYASILINSRGIKADPQDMKLIQFCLAESGYQSDALVGMALICSRGNLEAVNAISCRNVVSWTAVIAAYAEQGHCRESLGHFEQMQLEGVMPNEITIATSLYACANLEDVKHGKLIHEVIVESGIRVDIGIGSALISLYGSFGSVEEGCKVFAGMHSHNAVSWTSMMKCYAQNEQNREALGLYRQMQLQGMKSDEVTFVTVLGACSSIAAVKEIKLIDACIHESGYHVNDVVKTTLLSAYGKCGTLEDASKTFQQANPLRASSWSSMIAVAAYHGHAKHAVSLFRQMQQEGGRADGITFLSLLSACSHAGMADKGCGYFVSMCHDYGIAATADHGTCMVDLLGRAGRLEDAEELIRKMPFRASVSTWMAFLGGCRMHGDLERAERASIHVVNLNPAHAPGYIMLSNIYSQLLKPAPASGAWRN